MAAGRVFWYDDKMVLVPLLGAGTPVTDAWAKKVAKVIASDGCSGVPDFHLCCCIVHDLAYKFAVDPWGAPLTRPEADAAFRACIQAHSTLGRFSPMSWWRWAGVRIGGQKAWDAHRAAQEAKPIGKVARRLRDASRAS